MQKQYGIFPVLESCNLTKTGICVTIVKQNLYQEIVYIHRGVAQLVARVLWEHDAAGSSPVTPTTGSAGAQTSGVVTAYFFIYHTRVTVQ